MFQLPTFVKCAIAVIAPLAMAPALAFGMETESGKPGHSGERSLIRD